MCVCVLRVCVCALIHTTRISFPLYYTQRCYFLLLLCSGSCPQVPTPIPELFEKWWVQKMPTDPSLETSMKEFLEWRSPVTICDGQNYCRRLDMSAPWLLLLCSGRKRISRSPGSPQTAFRSGWSRCTVRRLRRSWWPGSCLRSGGSRCTGLRGWGQPGRTLKSGASFRYQYVTVWIIVGANTVLSLERTERDRS